MSVSSFGERFSLRPVSFSISSISITTGPFMSYGLINESTNSASSKASLMVIASEKT